MVMRYRNMVGAMWIMLGHRTTGLTVVTIVALGSIALADNLPEQALRPLWPEPAVALPGNVHRMGNWKLDDWRRARDQLRLALVGLKPAMEASAATAKFRLPDGYVDAVIEQLNATLALFEAATSFFEKTGKLDGFEPGPVSSRLEKSGERIQEMFFEALRVNNVCPNMVKIWDLYK
jgi:hypothetical protein